MKRILTGIQPSGNLHIGNYFGAIKPILDLQNDKNDLFLFIANYHALTSLKNPKQLKENTDEAFINMLALGIDIEKTTFFIQSDIPEVLELNLILSNLTSMGLLERSHAYKDKVQKGITPNHGLFSYPVLMAADILLYNPDIVPVGKDQVQHVEIARNLATTFNNTYKKTFKLPEFKIEESGVIKGTDGNKMSKSYKNTIPIFDTKKNIKKSVNSIITDSKDINDIKNYENCTIYSLCKLFMNKNELENLKDKYNTPGEGYGHFKLTLLKKINDYFSDFYIEKEKLTVNKNKINEIKTFGKEKAQKIAKNKINEIKEKVGI